ncbi:LysR family transcriptional regulator [Roseateles cellulosilyticus]|uniref:LysR family transcriptional regulator n=1 Tax=Pelomonas cellulosilytica TaxID=2906762 RepID=A0ABS8XSX0_9BURK|nr:LysR family transcriptional regulator [Pelomonas sp. P8]MCE4554395.1 LysR family transcriptional regulator [Pelomonas sp. P8]
MNSIEWDDIRLMLAIHRAGTLTGAARLTGLSQPTLSRRLRSMEGSLGQKAFQRTGNGFSLTDEGLRLLPHAMRIEEEFLAMERQLQGAVAELQGQLRVASSDWFGATILSRWAAEFRRTHPGIVIELLTDARQMSLTHREADIAFRIAPFNEAGVIQRRFSRLSYGLYCSNTMPRSFPKAGSEVDLVTMNEAFEDLPDVVWLKKQYPLGRTVFGSNSREAQARHCADGGGLAVLPRVLAKGIPGLREVPVSEPPPSRDVWVGYHQDLRQTPRIRAFLEFVLEHEPGLQVE